MAKVIAMYRQPADPAAFDRYYFGSHLKTARRIPGLKRYEVSRGAIGTLDGPAPYYLIATLTFDKVADVQTALASPEGRATAADIANFATGGVDIYFYDSEEI
jgi:uncharacterized protein (TIGR02118 family)